MIVQNILDLLQMCGQRCFILPSVVPWYWSTTLWCSVCRDGQKSDSWDGLRFLFRLSLYYSDLFL